MSPPKGSKKAAAANDGGGGTLAANVAGTTAASRAPAGLPDAVRDLHTHVTSGPDLNYNVREEDEMERGTERKQKSKNMGICGGGLIEENSLTLFLNPDYTPPPPPPPPKNAQPPPKKKKTRDRPTLSPQRLPTCLWALTTPGPSRSSRRTSA